MLKRTEGIVLTSFPFGEADLIVTYLTPDFGIIKVFAKSPRKIGSRFGSSLEPLTHSRISFFGKEHAGLPRLTQSDILCSFQSLRSELNCFVGISKIIELTISCIPERDVNRKIYLLLLGTLHDMDGGQNGTGNGYSQMPLLLNHYKIKFLSFAGFAPHLDRCARCGQASEYFYVSQGSILCNRCANPSTGLTDRDVPLRLSPALVKFYADLLTWDSRKIGRIRPSSALLSELAGLIDMHVQYVLSRPLKSTTFPHS